MSIVHRIAQGLGKCCWNRSGRIAVVSVLASLVVGCGCWCVLSGVGVKLRCVGSTIPRLRGVYGEFACPDAGLCCWCVWVGDVCGWPLCFVSFGADVTFLAPDTVVTFVDVLAYPFAGPASAVTVVHQAFARHGGILRDRAVCLFC